MELTEEMYRQKYLKYKKKYAILKQQHGNAPSYFSSIANSNVSKLVTGTKGALCSNWRYFFLFDDTFEISPDDTYTLFNDKIAYLAYKLIDANTLYSNVIELVTVGTGGTITKERGSKIRSKYEGILSPAGIFYTSHLSTIKKISLPVGTNIKNLNFIGDPHLIDIINKTIEESQIKQYASIKNGQIQQYDKKRMFVPKVKYIISFLDEAMQSIYEVTYENDYQTGMPKTKVEMNNNIIRTNILSLSLDSTKSRSVEPEPTPPAPPEPAPPEPAPSRSATSRSPTSRFTRLG